jgi:hypothetical protein
MSWELGYEMRDNECIQNFEEIIWKTLLCKIEKEMREL